MWQILKIFFKFFRENLWAFLSLILLIIFGLINQMSMGEETSLYFWKHFAWQILGISIFIFSLLKFDYRRISLEGLWLVYGLLLLLLLIMAIFKKRWLILGPISFQPSEFLKVLLLYLISLYASQKQELKINNKELIFLFIIIILPLLLILPVDLDYAGIIFLTFFLFLLFIVASKRLIFLSLLIGIIMGIAIVPYIFPKLKPHQKGRIYGYLDPERYAKTWGYQLNQSLIAIGSGGLYGQGLRKGWSTRLNYIPAKNTDLAYAVWAEALGFLGSTLFLLLYGYLLYWGILVSKKSKDLLGKYLSLGTVLIFLVQLFF